MFLGAGCPLSIKIQSGEGTLPLIPDIVGITAIIRDTLTKSKEQASHFQKLEEHFVKDGNKDPKVEDMLSHIRALRTVVGKDEVRGLTAKVLDELDSKICQIIHEIADKTLLGNDTPYH
ncbi:MAG: hypothetical protein IBX72_14565 [Nitrospirae bacterium]|nr:hypothetical protein [Nitrospirota bacterium]